MEPTTIAIIGLVLSAASMAANEKAKADAKKKEIHESSKGQREPGDSTIGTENITAGAAVERSAKAEEVGAASQAASGLAEKTGSELTPDAARVDKFMSVQPQQTQQMETPEATAGLQIQPGGVASSASIKPAPAAETTTQSPSNVPTPDSGPKTGPGPKEKQVETKPETSNLSKAQEAVGFTSQAAELFSSQEKAKQEYLASLAEQSKARYDAEKARQNPYLWYKGGTTSG